MVVAVLALLSLPAVFLFGLMVGSGFRFSSLADPANLALWVSAGATLAIAILTIVLAKETWLLRLFQLRQLEAIRKASIRPQIDIYLSRSPTSFNVMNVVVENTGSGLARNIRFGIVGSNNGLLTNAESAVAEKLESLSFVASGIQALAPQRSKRSFLFIVQDIFGKHREDFFKICLRIQITYEDSEGDPQESTAIWDFGEMEGASEMGYGDPVDKAARQLEKISDTLQRVGRGSSGDRLGVNVYTNKDREQERQEWEEQHEAWRARQGKSDS
ncbi:hypothetical protein [Algiphilus sp.]|uniref:hypothetical protein n=1 Tax=Algiphilus sp. TaxID=1872431 RepID=UPI0032ED05B7